MRSGSIPKGKNEILHYTHYIRNTVASVASCLSPKPPYQIVFQPGKKHSELDKVVAQLPKIQYKGQTAKISTPLNPALFIPDNSGYYTYQGSLTTPPCSECVIWIVFKDPIEVSHDQVRITLFVEKQPL